MSKRKLPMDDSAMGGPAAKRRRKKAGASGQIQLSAAELAELGLSYDEFIALPEIERESIIYDLDQRQKEAEDRVQAKMDLEKRRDEESQTTSRIVIGSDSDESDSESEMEASESGSEYIPEGAVASVPQIKKRTALVESDDDFGPEIEESAADRRRAKTSVNSKVEGTRPRKSRFDQTPAKKKKMELVPDSEKPESARTAELSDLRAAQLTCIELEKMITEPYFETCVVGLYIRGVVKESSTGYRAMKIIGVQTIADRNSWYELRTRPNVRTDKMLRCLVPGHKSEGFNFRTVRVSNSPFDAKDFRSFCAFLTRGRIPIPLKGELREAMMNSKKTRRKHKYTENDLREMQDAAMERVDDSDARELRKLSMPALYRRRGHYIKKQEDGDKNCEDKIDFINEVIKSKTTRKKSRLEELSAANRRKNAMLQRITRKATTEEEKAFERYFTGPQSERFADAAKNSTSPKAPPSKIGSAIKNERDKVKAILKLKQSTELFPKFKRSSVSRQSDTGKLSLGKEDGAYLIRDPLWQDTVYAVAKDFRQLLTAKPISLPFTRRIEPIFGRSEAVSTYASEFETKPEGVKVLTLAEHNAIIHGQDIVD